MQIDTENILQVDNLRKNFGGLAAVSNCSLKIKKGPVPICPPDKQVKNFFDKIGTTVEIKNEKT